MKSFKDVSWVPSGGGWTFFHPETGHRIYASSFYDLENNVYAYNARNNIPTGANYSQKIIDQICERSPDACNDSEPPTFVELAVRFARAMFSWAASGFSCVTADQFATRQQICAGSETTPACSAWRGSAGFGYGKCGSCGCTGLKLFMTTEKCPQNKWPQL